MSSIDRISVNRYEPDNSLAQERKRQLARQHQLASRETTRLVLPTIEAQSRLAAKRSLDARRQGKDLPGRVPAVGPEAGSAYGLEEDLIGLAIDIASGSATASAEDTAERLPPRFISQRPASGSQGATARQTGKPEDAALANAQQQEKASEAAEATRSREAARDEAATFAEERASSSSIWLQKLDAAYSAARNASSAEATHALEELLEQLLHEVQTRAAQSEALPSDLKAALDALASKRMASFITDPDAENLSRLQGSFQFLDAFVETMGSTTAADRDAAMVNGNTIDKPDMLDVSKTALELAKDDADASERKSENEAVSPARDRQTLYEFLELLTSVAGSSTPQALQQLAQVRQTKPEKALLRLAASGDHAVALYTPEISRRFELISARIERDGKKSARASMLADAVATERQWMQSAIDQAESLVGYSALARRSEREEREKIVSETLPQLILQKT